MIHIEGMAKKKILIIDDETEILDLLETALHKEGFKHILKATSGYQGIEACLREQPDIIILDIMLPDIDGYEVCKKIREKLLAPIIFLSAKNDDIDKLLGLGVGGDDYVTKPFSPKEVAFRVKAQLRRSGYLDHDETKNLGDEKFTFGDIHINASTGEVKKGEDAITLRAKEFQLLVFLAKHPNQILSKTKLCESVWGEDYFGFDNTIMVHIRHLREKLEDDPSNPVYIKTVKGLGYKLVMRD